MKNILLLNLLISSFILSSQSLRDLYKEGVTAYEQKDYQTFKNRMFAIDSMRPNYPPAIYNLASAYALLGEKEKSFQKLNQFILMSAYDAFEEDEDFLSLQAEPQFYQLLDKRMELSREISVKIDQELSLINSHPESITYSKKLKAFFIGGVRDGHIWMMKNGQAPNIWTATTSDSWAIMGLDVSADGKHLWVCTTALDNHQHVQKEDMEKVSVLKYDIKKKRLIKKYVLPPKHVFGDLVVDKKGNVFISDSQTNHIYTISKEKEELERFMDLSNQAFSLQGLTLNDDQTQLFVSDYISGIYKLDISKKKIIHLNTTEQVLLKGIDGLYYQDGYLIALHNGTRPNRVVKYQLDTSENQIVNKQILAQAGLLDEPTQGTFIGNTFYYIANSPWGAYNEETGFKPANQTLIIGKIE